jgi:hypothetical protein
MDMGPNARCDRGFGGHRGSCLRYGLSLVVAAPVRAPTAELLRVERGHRRAGREQGARPLDRPLDGKAEIHEQISGLGRLAEAKTPTTALSSPTSLYQTDVETFPARSGKFSMVACIESPQAIERILRHRASKALLGLWPGSEAPSGARTGLPH